jgi:hypothetical protein
MALLKSRHVFENTEHQLKHALDYLNQLIRRQRIEGIDSDKQLNFRKIMYDFMEKLLEKGHGYSGRNVNEYYVNLFSMHYSSVLSNPIAVLH